jgi:hypothetical protein
VNASLWSQAASALEETPGSEAPAAAIRTIVAKANIVFSWMTEPDGSIVQVGDTEEQAGASGPETTARVLRDDQAGWIVGRWSWTDPATSYYTVRYGPARFAHGHQDRAGGVTWSVGGVRVLVGPGRYTSDLQSNYNAYQVGPQGQNAAIPDSRTAGSAAAAVTASKVQASSHNWTIKDRIYGVDHVRGVNVNRDAPSLTGSDSFAQSSVWRQYWHLDPAWTLTSGGPDSTKLVFAPPSGRRLTMTTTGRVSSVVQGITRPTQGWHFPEYSSRYPAREIVVRSYGGACTTTFTLS